MNLTREKLTTKAKTIIEILNTTYPESKISLKYEDPFELLVATVLSAQTTDKSVNAVTPELFSTYGSPDQLSQANVEDVIEVIRSIGLYNRKANAIIKLAQQLVEIFEGQVPKTMKELTSLPGVGRKTANVVLGNGYGIQAGITIDTHMIRLTNRMGLVDNKDPMKIEKQLMDIIDKSMWTQITHLFISHGRVICTRKPKCDQCTVSEYCSSAFQFEK